MVLAPKIIEFPTVPDARGNLSFIEGQAHVPFKIARTYWIYDVPGGEQRGAHAFRENQEVIIALSGSFDVVLHDGQAEQRFHLNRSYYGIYVPEMTWRYLDNFSTNALALVMASTSYDPYDYIRDFGQFLKLTERSQ